MSHGIDICQCGATLQQCRCIGPHVPRVTATSCPACKGRQAERSVLVAKLLGALGALTEAEALALIGEIQVAIAHSHASPEEPSAPKPFPVCSRCGGEWSIRHLCSSKTRGLV